MAAIHHGNDAAADAFQRDTDIEGIAVNAVAPGSSQSTLSGAVPKNVL
jgi:hypothetical protein